MTDIDELRDETGRNSAAIAKLEERMNSHESRLARVESTQERMAEAIVMLRETVAKVATKEDVQRLELTVEKKFGEQLNAANKAVPAHIAMITALGMFGIAALNFALQHFGK